MKLKKVLFGIAVLSMFLSVACSNSGSTGTTTTVSTTSATVAPETTILPKFAKEYPFVAAITPEISGKVEARYKAYFLSNGNLKIDIILKNNNGEISGLRYRWTIVRRSSNDILWDGRDRIKETVETGKTLLFGPGLGNAVKMYGTSDINDLKIEITILNIE